MDEQISKHEKIVNQLKTWFGKQVDEEIIESIAYETEYDIGLAADHLIDITKNIQPSELNNYETSEPHEAVQNKPNDTPDNATFSKQSNQVAKPAQSLEEINVNRVIVDAKRGIRVLILLRGLPGSGKSYLAKKIIKESLGSCDPKQYILSADDYFYKNGFYDYNPTKLSDAHRWNQDRAHKLLNEGVSPIIIDNTNTQSWEFKPYCIWAVQNGYALEILEAFTPWAFNPNELAKRNRHNVPKQKIIDMLNRYEKNITVKHLFLIFKLCYSKLPPQPRNFPPILKEKVNNYAAEKICVEISDDEENVTPIPTEPKQESWSSWQVVESEQYIPMESDDEEFTNEIILKDSETMTAHADLNCNTCKILYASSSYQNFGNWLPKSNKSGYFDKSTTTDDLCVTNQGTVDYLISLFKDIPEEYLTDVLEKCHGNIDWAVEILLDDNKTILQDYTPIKVEKCESNPDDEVKETCTFNTERIRKFKKKPDQSSKQAIESNIFINKEHYTSHMLKIKGESLPSTSQAETITTNVGTVIAIDSDSEFDDLEDVIEISDDNDEQEMVEINLGDFLVTQLQKEFGDPNLKYPEGFQPIIEIPKALGRQLHALYLESIFKQMEAQNAILKSMIDEDEEFARKLQNMEVPLTTPDLKQVMDEQVEESKQDKINMEWENMTLDDIASKLAKEKLISSFPDIDAETLGEVLAAHDNCYQLTVSALLESGAIQTSEPSNVDDVNNIPIAEIDLDEIQEVPNNNFMQEEDSEPSANALRYEAQKHLRKRKKLLEKANLFSCRGMPKVAKRYLDLARQETRKCETFNNLAAEQYLKDNFNRLQNFDTIDLHHLFVKEAIIALDIFIDRNILLLNGESGKNSHFVLIITGRGKNSPGGIPRIKPAVRARLGHRGIKFEQVNGGLIRARILKTSPVSSHLAHC